MPKQSGKVPSYCRHKASGRAVVRIDGKDHYLGIYGSPESHDEYERLISEWRVQRALILANRKGAEERAGSDHQRLDPCLPQVR